MTSPIFITKAVHTAEELAKYPKIADQLPYAVRPFWTRWPPGATLEGVDCFVPVAADSSPARGAYTPSPTRW